MPNLKQSASLKDIQKYVVELEKERGFSGQSVIEKCLMLGEETGELFKAVRKVERIKVDPNSQIPEVSHELADILIFVCSIANRYEIDLETAFRNKEALNKKRSWK